MPSSHTYQEAEYLSIGETARRLGVTVETVRRWESAGKISGHRTPGGQRRFHLSEIERLTLPPALSGEVSA